MNLHHKCRWVLSPVQNGRPLVSQYVADGAYEMPLWQPGMERALVHCVLNANTMAALAQDSRFVIADSIHARTPVHPEIVKAHAAHGVKAEHTLAEALIELGKLHHCFLPEI